MLYIYMLKCYSFMQVKCNYRMGTGTIVKNSITRSSLKVYSAKTLFIESNYKSIGEKAQQVAFTPIIFAK